MQRGEENKENVDIERLAKLIVFEEDYFSLYETKARKTQKSASKIAASA